MNAEVRADRVGELSVQLVVQRYPLEPGLWITLTPREDSWDCAAESSPPSGAGGTRAADALAHLLRYHHVPPVDRFELVRHVPAPEASGERPVDDDGQVVVVGERVVVSWTRTIRDIPYTAPVTLAQLSAVNFLGIPDTHGVLLWTTPNGHEAPVAVVTRYLPRAMDGRQVLLGLLGRSLRVEPSETPTLAARMGRIAAALHVALATRSRVLAEPVRVAAPSDLLGWHHHVHAALDRAALIAAEGTASGVAAGYLSRLGELRTDADELARSADAGRAVLLQRVHGDLHVGRVLRWAGGLMITGFGDEPEHDGPLLGIQPPARDLARLLTSLTMVARRVDEQNGDERCVCEWLPDARHRLLAAYRTELQVANRPELFDERLLAAFEAEHTARDVVTAARLATADDPLDPRHDVIQSSVRP